MSNIIKCRLSRIKLNSQGYDSFGSYFGVGAPLWNCEWEGPQAAARMPPPFRAANLQNARVYIRGAVERHCFRNLAGELPEAKFVR